MEVSAAHPPDAATLALGGPGRAAPAWLSATGSWRKACAAAASLKLPGGTKGAARPWSSKHRGGYRGPKFTRQEVIDAVLQCAAAVDRIPSSNVYYDWSARERRKARERGGHLPRLPAQASVERHFKSWREVRAAVEEQLVL